MTHVLRRARLFAVLLASLAVVAVGVAVGTSGHEKATQRAECFWAWTFNPYPHQVWVCQPAGGGGGGSW